MISLKKVNKLPLKEFLKLGISYLLRMSGVADSKGISDLRHLFSVLSVSSFTLKNNEADLFYLVDPKKKLSVSLRKRPHSDIDTFRHVFIKQEYLPVVKLINDKNASLNIIDGGANIGLTSLFFLNNFKNSTVLSIEPEENNFELLKKNIELNKLEGRCNLYKGGLWSDSNVHLTFGEKFRNGSDDSFCLKETAENDDLETFSIRQIAALNNWELIDILKIDIEGAEKELFKTHETSEFLNITKYIAIEIHDEFQIRNIIYKRLEDYGFKYFESGELTIAFRTNDIRNKAY